MGEFFLNVVLNIEEAPEKEAVKTALGEMGKACVDEPGCVRWEAYESSEANTFIINEIWESKADWENHLGLPAFEKYYEGVIVPRVKRTVHFCKKLG